VTEGNSFKRTRLIRELMLCLLCFFPPLSQVNDLLLQYMRKIASSFLLPEGAEASQKGVVMKSKLALGLTLLTIVDAFQLPASKEDLAGLCELLCLEKSQKAVVDEFHQTMEVFASSVRYVCYWSSNWAYFVTGR